MPRGGDLPAGLRSSGPDLDTLSKNAPADEAEQIEEMIISRAS